MFIFKVDHMKKSIAIVAADTHLKPQTWVKRPNILGDEYRALAQVVDIANHFDVPLLLLGDIFDKLRPDSMSVSVFMQEMDRLKHPGFAIQGNHDRATPPWFCVSSKIQHIDQQIINLSGFRFIGYDYRSTPDLRRALTFLPTQFDVILLHQAWAEIQGVGADASLRELLPGCLAISGDCHISSAGQIPSAINGQPIRFLSPGNTAMQALNESPKKYVIHLYTNDGTTIEYENIELRSRPMYSMVVDTDGALENLVASLYRSEPVSEELKPILKVSFPETFLKVRAALEGEFDDRVHLFLNEQGVEETVETIAIATDSPLLTLPLAIKEAEGLTQPFAELLQGSLAAVDLDAYFNQQKQIFMSGEPYGVSTSTADKLLPTQ